MNTLAPNLPDDLQAAIEELATTLLQVGPLADYRRARNRYDNDPEVKALTDQYRAAQTAIQNRESNGTLTQVDLDELRKLYQRLQSHETITAFIAAQRLAASHLSDIVYELDDLIGLDFATFGNAATC